MTNASSHRFDNFGIKPELFDDVVTRVKIIDAKHECHIACVDHEKPDALSEAIHSPITHIIEIDATQPLPNEVTLHADDKGIGNLNLTTKTAFQRLVAKHVCALLEHHTTLREDARINIETALHEAIINAVVHGNLEVHSHFFDMDGLQEHYDTIHNALEAEEFAKRRIHITLRWNTEVVSISVSDEGHGFEPKPKAEAEDAFNPASIRPHGMGLDLIHACTLECAHKDGGRTLEMVFAL